MNLMKEVRGHYNENYEILMKEGERSQKKWKDIVWSQIERMNIIKTCLLLLVAIYRLNAICITIPMTI